jgi:hypothetical protein
LATLLDEVTSSSPVSPLDPEKGADAAVLNQKKFIDNYFQIIQNVATSRPNAARVA